jgi:DNA repair exonuclease SbcCD ATPase subunit
MASNPPDKSVRSSSSAVALVECSIRVSPALARLIRKTAEKEASGTSATDALLTAAGIQPGEVTTLRKNLEQISKEAREWREQAAREHGQLEQSKTAAVERDKALRSDLRKATDSLKGAQQQIYTLEARIAELSATLESRDRQLAYSLSLFGLDDEAAAAVKALRARLTQDEIRFASDTAGEIEDMIANLDRPEMRNLSKMLTHRGWRFHIIRWLLRVPARP